MMFARVFKMLLKLLPMLPSLMASTALIQNSRSLLSMMSKLLQPVQVHLLKRNRSLLMKNLPSGMMKQMLTSFPITDSRSFRFTWLPFSYDLYKSWSSSFNCMAFILGKKIRSTLVLISQPRTTFDSSNQPSAINLVCCSMLERLTCSIAVNGRMRQSRIKGMTFLILLNRLGENRSTIIKSSI